MTAAARELLQKKVTSGSETAPTRRAMGRIMLSETANGQRRILCPAGQGSPREC